MTRRSLIFFAIISCLLQPTGINAQFHGQSKDGLVATVHPLATQVAVHALESGGNAIDAALSAAFMLGVVDSHNSGIGGGCFILIRRADGSILAIDGRETAPAAATREMYLVAGKPSTSLSKTGPLAAAVPSAVAAYHRAWQEAGDLQWLDVVLPSAIRAEKGVSLSASTASAIKSKRNDLARFPASAEIFLNADGTPKPEGDMLIQTDLAATLRGIASNGPESFYHGRIAQLSEAAMHDNGGIITAADFANCKPTIREPVVSNYRGHTIIGFPPASSGGIHVAQVLNILEKFDLARLYREDQAVFYHVIIEAMKLAFADRAHWLGDADYAPVPKNLISQRYANRLSRRIDLGSTSTVAKHSTPPRHDSNTFGQHTTHIAVADTKGNWVAMTQTINTHMGSKFVIPGTGVLLNNEMDDFSIAPGVPNAFGLLGSEANEVAPGKRPLSSMSPTIVLKDGVPIFTLGAAGGPTIISQVIMGIVQFVDLGMSPEQQLLMGKVHHQWSPNHARITRAIDSSTAARLRDFGHNLKIYTGFGVRQMIYQDPISGIFYGSTDAKVPSTVSGPNR
ncbi:MAG: gamma-glutamyltransferase [Pirellulaceae bacterium]